MSALGRTSSRIDIWDSADRREPVEYCEMKYVPPYRYKTRISKLSAG